MRYLLMCCFDEKQRKELPESQLEAIMREYGGLIQSLDSSTATTVRGRNGKLVINDGPFAETKEQLGG